ncbi:MAG: N(4)-(beta-N-acetylglucosaminyl)-L-asparaginase [Bacteroidales bacterium]|jgi:isoaspartyl peptidase/L-asparaginase-like protein (Ntn-hydrolase superfamily)|nr:N(4)-(beta-N-acetylglucosaminyl)-L-asparaginase [Bacteroidales bacterium]
MKRRHFLSRSAIAAGALALPSWIEKVKARGILKPVPGNIPMVISTWNFGYEANETAWKILANGGSAVDAVEAGVRVPEADPDNMSVGYGGLPDRDGNVTLDACIMKGNGECGSVTFLEHIKHPVSVARMVMEKTPHVMLSGEGALQFALENGFIKENLLTEKARKAWEAWRVKSEYEPVINIENHDTIGMLAIDNSNHVAGACTTSGLAYKMHGRVGDSPVIGAGLFADDEVGAATATGMGELVLKTLGSFLMVELMRNGYSPQEACEEGIRRIVEKIPHYKDFQIGYLTVNNAGETGAYAIQKGFNYALFRDGKFELIDSDYYLK